MFSFSKLLLTGVMNVFSPIKIDYNELSIDGKLSELSKEDLVKRINEQSAACTACCLALCALSWVSVFSDISNCFDNHILPLIIFGISIISSFLSILYIIMKVSGYSRIVNTFIECKQNNKEDEFKKKKNEILENTCSQFKYEVNITMLNAILLSLDYTIILVMTIMSIFNQQQ